MLEWGTLTAVVFVTSAVSAMVGFGGGAVLLAALLLFMPPAIAIPFHGMLQLVANSSRVVLLRRWIGWRLVVPYLLLLPLGAVLGRWLFSGLGERAIFMLIGLFVLATLLSREVPLLRGREYPPWFYVPLGLLVGVLGSTVGVVGVLVAPFLDRRDLTKEGINGTMAIMTAAMHLMKIVAFAAFGFAILEHLAPLAWLAPAVILGSYCGKAILVRFSERMFRLLFKSTLAALALKLMLWDGLMKAIM